MHRAPLTMLLDTDAATVAERMHRMIVTRGWQDPTQLTAASGREFSLICQALSLRVSVVDSVPELAEYEAIFLRDEVSVGKSALTVSFDHHLSGAQFISPVVRTYLEHCANIASDLHAVAVAWHPSQTLVQSDYFAEAVAAYVQDGAFPALALVHFDWDNDFATVRTQGLGWFSGQEIALNSAAANHSRSELMRRAVRLVHDIAVNGPVSAPQILADLDPDMQIQLCPDLSGTLLNARIVNG